MLTLHLNMYQTIGAAAVMLVLGQYLVEHIKVLRDYCLPAPVVGGLIFALVHAVLRGMGLLEFNMDTTLQGVFMIAFFCTVGFLASFEMLKKGGAGVVKFLMIAIVAILIQDLIGGVCAPLFGLDAKLGLAMGSVALVGGHGTSASFGPYLEELNAAGATTVAIASATYGLVAGCVIGGPIATARIRQYKLSSRGSSEKATVQVSVDTDTGALDADDIKFASILIVVSVGLGTLVSLAIGLVINMPAYIGAMLTAAVIRNVADARGKTLPMPEITTLGNVCLSLFLSQAMISMKLWELVSLAVPMIAILLLQTVVMALYAYFVVFMAMGRDYDAATMSAGFCGFGMGATPNAIANMQAITKKYGPSPVSFMIVPLVGALFIDFFNASLITLFANFF